MPSNTDDSSTSNSKRTSDSSGFWWSLVIASALWVLITLTGWDQYWLKWLKLGRVLPTSEPEWSYTPAPLVMQGGDPYIRALMRTISASEANSNRPYSLLYGGEHVYDLSQHPDICVTIVAGPNTGDCTTAAGRYQMLTTTWLSKASEYHPKSPFAFWDDYSFEPEFQDEVVYHWLNDPTAWGVDLAELLRQGQLQEVLAILSPTWTSLGYGIETNDMTAFLPGIYEQMLQEELQTSWMP